MSEQHKSIRIRVNVSRTAKGFSVDATTEFGINQDGEMATRGDWRELSEQLEAVALERLESVMAKLNAEYPREG